MRFQYNDIDEVILDFLICNRYVKPDSLKRLFSDTFDHNYNEQGQIPLLKILIKQRNHKL